MVLRILSYKKNDTNKNIINDFIEFVSNSDSDILFIWD